MAERDWREVRARCNRFLSFKPATTARELLTQLAAEVPEDAMPDRYGGGELVEGFEAGLAELLGKEAARLMPSGTLAQLAAVRVWCDRRGIDTIGFHPTCHLELHEERAYERLHGLHAALVGGQDRLIEIDDLERIVEPIAVLLLELPQRELGGLLPEWDDLVALCGWARERGVALHLDGARLWECGPYYGRPYAEIAGLFDTVYASPSTRASAASQAACWPGPRTFWPRRGSGRCARAVASFSSSRWR